MKTHLGMAMLPERWEKAREVLMRIGPQVDRADLSLNGFEAIPEDFPYDSFKSVEIHLREGRQSCETKFFPTNADYYLTLDDDILVPEDYVEGLVNLCEMSSGQCIWSHHGHYFPPHVKHWRRSPESIIHRFQDAQPQVTRLTIIGTGCAIYPGHIYQDILRVKRKSTNMSDLAVSRACRDLGVQMMGVPHAHRELKALSAPKGTTIWENVTRHEDFNKIALKWIYG